MSLLHVVGFGNRTALSSWLLLLCALCVLLFSSLSHARPELSLPDVNVLCGTSATIDVRVHDLNQPCSGANAAISLPPGVSCMAVSKGALAQPDGFWIKHAATSNAVSFVLWSRGESLGGESGVLASLHLSIASNAVPGTYPVVFVDGRHGMAHRGGEGSIHHIVSDGTLTIDVDEDGNGMGDAWEAMHFGSNTAIRVAAVVSDRDGDGLSDVDEFVKNTDPNASDTDGDGMSDLEEVAAGTDGADPADYLAINHVEMTSNTGIVLEWSTVPGRQYRVMESVDLLTGFVAVHRAFAHGPRMHYRASAGDGRFYRIAVEAK